MNTQLRAAVIGFVVVLSAGGSAAALHGRREPIATAVPSSLGLGDPVVVELFSSEGCSSCPPADRYLAALDRAQSVAGVAVLALELHVDYWDRLGWQDPFAHSEFTARQEAYARVLGDHRTFTPEIVIQGNAILQGGDENQAQALMKEAAQRPHAKVAISKAAQRLSVSIDGIVPSADGDSPEVWLAVTESGLTSNVASGENAGKSLVHAPIVRSLKRIGVAAGNTFHGSAPVEVQSSWAPSALRWVVFVQEARSRQILGAGAT